MRTTLPDQSGRRCPDLIGRDFSTGEPNRRYVGDITYLPVEGGTNLYFASYIDLGSRKLAGWAMADHMRTELVEGALEATRRERGSLTGSVFHSDHGSVYTSKAYAALCEQLEVTQSMGAIGSSADNALAESHSTRPSNVNSSKVVLRFPTRPLPTASCSAGRTATTPGAVTPRSAISARTPTKPLSPLPSWKRHNRNDTVSKIRGQGPS